MSLFREKNLIYRSNTYNLTLVLFLYLAIAQDGAISMTSIWRESCAIFFRITMLLIIARVIGTATISSLFLGKVQWFGSYQRRSCYRRFYILPGDSSLSSAAHLLHGFVLHSLSFTVDSQSEMHTSSTYITNSCQLFMLDFSSSLYISFDIVLHTHQEETSHLYNFFHESRSSREDEQSSSKTFQIR